MSQQNTEQKDQNDKDFDTKILETLQAKPTASDDHIAEQARLSKKAIEQRLKGLRKLGYVTPRLRLADLVSAGLMLRYRIDITINPPALNASCKAKGRLENCHPSESNKQIRLAFYIRDNVAKECDGLVVEEVSILLGNPADICVTVLVPDHKSVFTFVTEQLRSLEEIQATSTSHVSWRTSSIVLAQE